MAKKTTLKAQAEAKQPLELTAMQHAILGNIMQGEAGELGYALQVVDDHMHPLYEAEYVVANKSIANPATGAIAHKLTQAGIDAYERYSALTAKIEPANVSPVATTSTKGNSIMSFEIETDVAMPDFKAKGGQGRAATYPFDALGVGHSFFIPATEDRPEPHKALVSVVNQATLRYARVLEGERAGTRVNRKGVTVPLTENTRVFKLVKGERNGLSGARVFRIQ